MNKPEYIFIHCTDLSYKTHPDQFWAVDRYHHYGHPQAPFPKSSLGYYCGYHRLSSNGMEYKAREDSDIGAHCNQLTPEGVSYNVRSLAYCIAFDGDIEYPPQKDIDNAIRTIKEWQMKYGIPLKKVIYHRVATPWKTCPGSLIPDDYFSRMLLSPPVLSQDPEQKEKKLELSRLYSLLDELRTLLEKLKRLLTFQ